MSDIVLVTFNARYHHAAFGLRYLKANLGELAGRCEIIEFDLEKRPVDAVEAVLARSPKIVGLGVYVWNTRQCAEFARALKAVRPDVTLILGGPEISYEAEEQPISLVADQVIAGEADLAFAECCRKVLRGEVQPKMIVADPPDLSRITMPYALYDEQDLKHRTIYVESSRGCPFSCEFCLSSLDIPLRRFPLPALLEEMQKLLDRGARRFKFVDRTFNVHLDHSCAILDFYVARLGLGLFLHFEVIPDHLPDRILDQLAKFPPGTLQLEVGVQTFDPEVGARIGRRQEPDTVQANLRRLRMQTNAHVHADLIAGLPGESLDSFMRGFDRLVTIGPHEIQLGILKRLRGAPIARHTEAFGMVYSPDAPYEILQNNLLDFAAVQRLKRMARYWDLFANSGNFALSLPMLWQGTSPAQAFLEFSDEVYRVTGKTHEISLARQFELLLRRLGPAAGHALAEDYLRPGRRDLPDFLQPFAPARSPSSRATVAPTRQARHLA